MTHYSTDFKTGTLYGLRFIFRAPRILILAIVSIYCD